MKQQRITVNTKGGLLAAFECAKGVRLSTIITLKTKSKTIIFNLSPFFGYKLMTKKEWNNAARHPIKTSKNQKLDYKCNLCGELWWYNTDAILCCLDKYYVKIGKSTIEYNISINKDKAKIRKIPAKELLL